MGRLNERGRPLPPVVAAQRNAILFTLLGLAALGWIVVVNQARRPLSMSEGMQPGPDLTMGSGVLFLSMWVAMTAAMMFPAAAPMILMYAHMKRRAPAATALFTGSYIALWIAFGLVAFALGLVVERAASRSTWVLENWGRAAGALVVLGGVYQLTPLKDICLRHCRTPMSFVMHHWRDGLTGALRMGLTHGLYCLGCCWMLFLILVPLGVMNIVAMVTVTAVVFAEKTLPWGRGVSRATAAGLILFGVAIAVRPGILPTV